MGARQSTNSKCRTCDRDVVCSFHDQLYGRDSKLYPMTTVSVDDCDFYRCEITNSANEGVYVIPDDTFDELLNDLTTNGLHFDGCACGIYVYQLDKNLYITISTSCRKSSSCPVGVPWIMDEIEFYANVPLNEPNGYEGKYLYRDRDVQLPLKLNKQQVDAITEVVQFKMSEYEW